jgi:hypothetical protein
MRRTFSIILLIHLVFLPIFLPVGVTAQEEKVLSAEGNSGLLVEGRLALLAITAYIDEQIGCMAKLLETVAITKEAQSGQWEKVKPLLVGVEKRAVPAVIFFARPDGTYFTTEKGMIDKNIKDRPYFPAVMGGNISVGELLVSRSTGKNVTIVAVPVRVENHVVGLLGASIYLDEINKKVLQALRLPDNMIFYAFDDNFITALHFRPEFVFQDPTKLHSQSLANAIKEIIANREGYTSYQFEGKIRDVIYHTSSFTGWHIVLGVVRE